MHLAIMVGSFFGVPLVQPDVGILKIWWCDSVVRYADPHQHGELAIRESFAEVFLVLQPPEVSRFSASLHSSQA